MGFLQPSSAAPTIHKFLEFLLPAEMGQLLSCAKNTADDVKKSRAALQRCPPGHPCRPMCLKNLAASLESRFKQRDVSSDLDEAIEHYRAALALYPPGHSDRYKSLDNLGGSLCMRFEYHGVLSDIDEVIELRHAMLPLVPPGHSKRHKVLTRLAINHESRFQHSGVVSDLDEAIEHRRAALAAYPPDRSGRSIILSTLATSLESRFEQRGVPSDIDEVIELHQAVLLLHPPGHSSRSESLKILGPILFTRFEQRGALSDLDDAIEHCRAALALYHPGHFDRSIILSTLATSLESRFEQQGVQYDLDEVIELYQDLPLHYPPGHSGLSAHLNNLGTILLTRFKQQGVPSNLDKAIELFRAALALVPPGHSIRSTCLNNLAMSLQTRFEHRGVLSDLDEAIEHHRIALALFPPGHSDRSACLNNLAGSLLTRFEHCGVLSDLDEAIEHHRVALALVPPSHSDRSKCLNNLAVSLQTRFEHRGVLSDLDEAIEHHRVALALVPPGHSNRSVYLDNLAGSLLTRFEHCGVLSDLDEAIEHHRVALALVPPSHSDRSKCLNNLAGSLKTRFQHRGVLSDLDEAIEHHRVALALVPPGHSNRSTYLNNLAGSLRTRFEHCGVLSDLDEAIEHHRVALALSLPGHSHRSACLSNLARSFQHRFRQFHLSCDLDEAFALYLQLSQVSHAVSRQDLCAAKSWATSAEDMNHSSALIAYQTTLRFLDQHVAALSSSSRHFDAVREASSSHATDAFSYSVRHGALTTAVELVEQGRAVFWTQLARFRSPLDDLSLSNDTGAVLAEEFKRLSFCLRNVFDQSTEDQSPQIRQLTMQWDDVVSRIRMLPDFSRFLLPPLFSSLQKAAEDGPVIIVNASQYGCDALIIHSAEDPVHVPLDITQVEVSELSSEFQSLANLFGTSDDHTPKLVGILRKLWHRIVDPVVQALRESKVHPGSRIWWCPTAEFTLLPLHAAGPYEKKGDTLSHIYISSYTPTLAALVRARQQVSRDASPQYFVAIGQGNPDGGKALQHVAPELAVVAQRLAPVISVTTLADGDATVQGALDALDHNQWLHLACHGMPNRQQPFESSFSMCDGPLMIKDIIRSNWQNPEFAFLSACHTTVGDEKSPDESIHLAAAMQFSGFRSVIGSMWSVDDEVAQQVVSAFYGNLVDDSGRLDCTRAAVALHKALKSLRKKIPLEQQIVFIHMGV
ncbi:TPR-like protein [Suillus lakei]|nr:TPR-like protein [Suillus lakei]